MEIPSKDHHGYQPSQNSSSIHDELVPACKQAQGALGKSRWNAVNPLRSVGPASKASASIHTHPPKRLWLPSWRVMSNPRQVHEFGINSKDQVGQRPSCKVGGGQTIPHVSASATNRSLGIELNRCSPVSRNSNRATPAMCYRGPNSEGKEFMQDPLKRGEHRGVVVKSILNCRPKVIRSATTTKGKPVICSPLAVDQQMSTVSKGLTLRQSDLLSDLF